MPFASTAILICCKLTVPHLFAEEGDPIAITTESVVARMVQSNHTRDVQLRDYTSVRHYSLRNQRFDTRATMTVRMTYRFPGQKRFEVMEESGPPTVRKKVLRRMLESELEASRDVARRESTQITPANYTFRLVGSETVSGPSASCCRPTRKPGISFCSKAGYGWTATTTRSLGSKERQRRIHQSGCARRRLCTGTRNSDRFG